VTGDLKSKEPPDQREAPKPEVLETIAAECNLANQLSSVTAVLALTVEPAIEPY